MHILEPGEKVKLVQFILSDLVIGVLDVAFIGMMLVVINFYLKGQEPAALSLLPKAMLNKNSLLFITTFLILFCCKNCVAYLSARRQQQFFYGVASRLSERNIRNYLRGDYLRFVHTDSSVLIRRISNQPIEFSNYILTNVQQVVSQTVLILLTMAAVVLWHPGLFFILLLLLLPPVIVLANFIRHKLKLIRNNNRVVSQKVIQHLRESLDGYLESNVYRKDDFFVDRYQQQQEQLNCNIATQQTLQGLTSRLVEVFAIMGFFVLIAINKFSSGMPAVSLLTIGVFMAASYKIIPGLIKILNSTSQIKTYAFNIADLQPGVSSINIVDEQERLSSIVFNHVSFRYDKQDVLAGLSFKIQSGDFVGLSSASGKGKTTLVQLLLGFLKFHEGSILFNGNETDWIKRQSFLSRVSYVKQQTFIINDTVAKNIALSEEPVDIEKLNEVIDFCGLNELLSGFKNGINENIRESGKNISGGQRQRLMLARALYHDFDLLVLDEPFSEMDERAEREILGRLKQLSEQGEMIILITHNTASLEFCNKIISPEAEQYA